MRRPCRRPRPEGPPPFGIRAPSARDRAPRRPRPPGNPPAKSPSALPCHSSRDDVAGHGGVVVVEDNDPCDVARQGGPGGDRLTRREPALHPATAGSDPLMHSGRWVPAEYSLCKELPWTGYWTCCGNKTAFATHCPDFEARIRQREADHRRDSAEQLDRARQRAAAKFREEWESKRNPTSSFPDEGDSCDKEQQNDAENQHPVKGTNIVLSHQSKRHRPFLRPRWLQFRQSAAAGHQVPAPGTPSVSTETSGAGPVIPKKPAAATIRVRKDHIRSVIHLALSEARINAFVVISCLEGLLSVAMEGMRQALEDGSPNILDAPANNSDNKGSERNEKSCTNTKRHIALAARRGERDARQAASASVVPDTVPTAIDKSSSTRREESGAALCVRLGALPAVLGCLNEHAGHKQIEPLAIRLLSIFASDCATSGAVRGNTTVAGACTSRMFPVVATPVAGGARCTGPGSDASEPRSLSLKSVCGGDETRASAASGRSKAHADDGRSLESVVPTEEVSGRHAASTPATTATSKPSTTPKSVGTTLASLASSADRPAASVEDISQISRGQVPSSEALTAATSTKRSSALLPATDLVFVLSEAVQGNSECQRLVIQRGGIAAMLATLRQQAFGVDGEASTCVGSASACSEGNGGPRLVEMCLRVMEGLGQPERGRRRLVREGAVETAIATIGRFRSDDGVLAAATGLLLLLSDSPKGRGRILKAGGFLVVFEAVQRLVGNAVVQVKGVEMLQTLISEERQARCELDSIKGGWQWLCQGTSGGNALVRYSPGEKHISGWTVSEEEKLTTQEALATAEMAASDWTPYNLATFMGTMRTGSQHKLQIGNLAYYHFFRVVSEASLLPHAHEDVEDWRDRMRRYEDERHIRVGSITRRRLARDKSGAHARSLGSSSTALTR